MVSLHVETPVWLSAPMSRAAGVAVSLKMEALQPVGSFKIRGIGRACQQSVTAGARRLLCSSGGNAGFAVAYAGRQLDVPVEVFVPRTTPAWMRDVIRAEEAVVTEHGASWDDAHAHAATVARDRPDTAYIHPFDDPRIWAGHASLIHEVAATARQPDAIVASVGGGGLMIGLVAGMHEVGWRDVPLIAVETRGADSFARSVAAGRLVTLDRIDSIATSLGARTVAAAALDWFGRHEIVPIVVDDRAAVAACGRFADDHRVLVEPACGASLAVVYDGADVLRGKHAVLVVVCGGAGVSRRLLAQWHDAVNLPSGPARP